QGQVSDAARETVRKALAALPTDESPGRMTRVPEAAGFGLLAGIKPRVPPPAGRDFSRAVPPLVGRDLSRAVPKKQSGLSRALPTQAEAAAAAQEKAIAAAERTLQQARKAAEQAKFQVRKRQTDLENAQAAEERLAADVALAQRKLDELRRR